MQAKACFFSVLAAISQQTKNPAVRSAGFY